MADDASPSPDTHRLLRELADSDPRIRLTVRDNNGHISAASNTALEIASGEYVALLDHDDELAPYALEMIARATLKSDGQLLHPVCSRFLVEIPF